MKQVSVLVLTAVATLATYWIVLFALQRRILFPAPATHGHGSPPPDARRIWLTGSGSRTEAWLLPGLPVDQPPSAVILFAHGNGELIDYWAGAFDDVRVEGVAVMLVEYPGYGRSEGRPSERSIGLTLEAAFDWIVRHVDVRDSGIIGYGRSLGGAAMAGLSQGRPLAALILESTFTSTRPFARRLGAPGFLVRDVFDARSAVRDFHGPLLVMHGIDDRIVPIQHGRDLAAAGRVQLHELPCGHNDCQRPWDVVRQFLIEIGIVPKV